MKLKHPESKPVIDVTEDRAEPYLSQGWEQQGGKSATADEPDK